MDKRKIKIPQNYVRAEIGSKSFNSENRTVDVIFSTGSRVLRVPFFDEPFYEELSMDPKHIRLDRLNGGAPVLNNHSSRELDDVIGVVENARVDGKKGFATLRFSDREDIQGIVRDIENGILRNVSIGYRVNKFEEIERKKGDDYRTLRAVDYEPFEISIVGVPADRKAQVRNESLEENDCEIVLRGTEMDEKTKTGEVVEAPVVETRSEPKVEVKVEKVVDEDAVNKAVETERKRVAEIEVACRAGGIEGEEKEKFIKEGTSVDAVRKLIVERLEKKDMEKETRSKVEVGNDNTREHFRAGIENAILHRVGNAELNEHGKEFKNNKLMKMAERLLSKNGVRTENMTDYEIATRAMHSTSDFPEILANVLNKSLQNAYEVSPATYEPFTRMRTVSDFKQISSVKLGEGEALEKVLEGGEFKKGTVSESAEKYQVEDYGKIYAFTRKMLINDDLSAFDRLPAIMANRARDLESDLAWAIITGNPIMSDGFALFSSDHDNLAGAGAAPSITTLGNARSAMRLQVGLDLQYLNIRPQYLMVPPQLETVAEQLVSATLNPDDTSKVNPFNPSGRTPLQVIVEPRLGDNSSTAWYLAASLNQVEMLEMAKLEGQEAPFVDSQMGFEIDGIQWKIRHTLGVQVLDHRGLYKNAGA